MLLKDMGAVIQEGTINCAEDAVNLNISIEDKDITGHKYPCAPCRFFFLVFCI